MLLNAGIIASSGGSALWTPAEISTSLWLDFSDSTTLFDATSGGNTVGADGTIARAEDKSGNTNHAINATSGERPIRKVAIQNGLDTARWDGSDDRLVVTDNSTLQFGTGDYSIFWVGEVDNASKGSSAQHTIVSKNFTGFEQTVFQGSLAGFVAGTGFTAISGVTNNTWLISGFTRISGTYVNKINGDTSTTGSLTGNVSNIGTNVEVGNRTGATGVVHYGSGDMGEIIIVPAASTSSDTEERIVGYLAHKWGLTANLPSGHPYKNDPPLVI